MNRSSMGTMSLTDSTAPCPASPGQHFGIGGQIAVQGGGQFHRNPDGLLIGQRPEFQLHHMSASLRFED